MNNKVPIYLLVFYILNYGCKNTVEKPSLNLIDFGIEKTNDATPVVVEAIKTCKENGIRKLVFPRGTYHFYSTFAPDKYCAITNNDNGLKRTAFPLIGFDGLEIDGNGSDFIFHGKMIPFIIEDSKNLTIKNLSIDWAVPFCLEGDVVANNPTENTFDIKIKTPYKVSNGHLYLCLEREDSPYERKYGFRFAGLEKDHLEIGQNIIFDPKTMAPLFNNDKYSGFGHISLKAEGLENGNVRIYSIYDKVPPAGSVFCSNGEYLFNRPSPAFRLFKSKNLVLNNLNVHHAGAMGLIAERCENITLDGFNVVLKEGDGRMVTTTADATHFCNCKGEIIIRNCTFENMLDDATNIHGTYVRVNKILDDFRVAVETYHPHQNDYIFGETGDSVRIVNKSFIPTIKNLLLTNVERINEKISILTFNESIKGKVEKFYGIENISWNPTALLENNIVRNNRARGFLIAVPRKVIVRNNYISSEMAGLRIKGDLGLWNESGPSDSLIIENNTFEDCAYGGKRAQSIILIDPQYDNESDIRGSYSRNIIIRNNKINTFDASLLWAVSVDGLTFESNLITQTKSYPPIFPDLPHLRIENCNRILIRGNIYHPVDDQYPGKIKIDSKSTNIQVVENQGFI